MPVVPSDLLPLRVHPARPHRLRRGPVSHNPSQILSASLRTVTGAITRMVPVMALVELGADPRPGIEGVRGYDDQLQRAPRLKRPAKRRDLTAMHISAHCWSG